MVIFPETHLALAPAPHIYFPNAHRLPHSALPRRASSCPLRKDPGKHILLVEDDPDARNRLTLILSDQGHRVDTANDGLEALDCLRADSSVDLILLDLQMLRMNGWEFRQAQLAEARLAAIPVVVLTNGSELASRPDSLGEVGYLQKPVNPQQLAETIQRFARGENRKSWWWKMMPPWPR